ncbi:dTDP-4-dehydrorhamnose 3,5-epimerase family protein [Phaeobacter gallaeciensis]|uniref:dTDP-4-dehydrorhamnose 3,5-epimerase family protein n=1 Tax=Phaeobacter gallaeciensis TaxID=60890 RepID=UPI00237FACEC|nr:dTDP-4-dehydrorhamnose 3,5-epimerase family protein [Phaeobacter gallaeciensis]MDE4365259.1 dTDP-4-dehydrorhamnose 3,5-epimerase family protein [Phaeobacter gallaeciensis]MDE4376425.1 dTDP-4-dehydrorhamnose 3,5-epimerase family protein [Phaeobacter gallaeciensis]MDE4396379.1 dTDP-4-dehydrorhamnose 3,5-epimerase family protein [Phaeobacter gallaeciensis]MDE4405045.1 dTDP-4-dehydrorhamnose 3,5-epimerase family protein [Phaeobacter gallaeciensis]
MDDVFVLKRFTHADERGIFTKTYNYKMFDELNLGESIEIRESLCSISKKNVIRGMHYQTAPYGCAKIISVVKGEIIDVIVGVGGASNERNKGKFSPLTYPTKTGKAHLFRLDTRTAFWLLAKKP